MAKQYEESLVQALKDCQTPEDYHGAPLLVKNLPDCDEKGAMDPRLYRDQKKALQMMAWIPSFLMKMDTSEKGIANLQQMFNGVKSEHDFLKVESLGYGVKLHKAGVETKMVLYKGFGHAHFDNTGVYPQTEDCIDEMASFVLAHCKG